MRMITTATVLCLVASGCGEPASKEGSNSSTNQANSSTNNSNSSSSNNASLNNSSTNSSSGTNSNTNSSSGTNSMSTNNANNELGGVGEVCNADAPCQAELRCQSAEERAWNFCGAPMEPECTDAQVGDSCGNCFTACSSNDECEAPQTCNGTYCIGEQTCNEEVPPPP